VTVKPHFIGKVATVLQMVTVCWALLKLPADGCIGFALGAAVCRAARALFTSSTA